jgi:predicted transposase YdaD
VAQHYDATFKQLVEAHPSDWIALVGLPPGTEVAAVEAELSSITAAADKVIRVGGPAPYIAHLEFQAGPDPDLDRRVLMYNVLLRWRHNLPVRSVVLLLQPKAMTPRLVGGVTDVDHADWRLEFRYRAIRAWEQPTALFMGGGIGTLPLAPVTLPPAAEEQLAGVLEAIADRLRREAKPEEAKELWAATHFLSGLRHDVELVERLMKGVWSMDLEESVTYQAAVARGVTKGRELGRVEGRVEEARKALLLVGRRRFGEPDSAALARLEQINDADRLEALIDRLLIAADWHNLLADER